MQRHGRSLKGKRIVVLDVRDDYAFVQPEQVELPQRKVGAFLR